MYSSPTAVSRQYPDYDVFYRGASYNLRHTRYRASGGWIEADMGGSNVFGTPSELYVDPWTDEVFITVAAEGGAKDDDCPITTANGAFPTGHKYEDTVLFRSTDGAATWDIEYLEEGEARRPVMMTSLPTPLGGSVLVTFQCYDADASAGADAVLRWSFDGGPFSAPYIVGNDTCGNGPGPNMNSVTVSRVGTYLDDNLDYRYAVRVSYPHPQPAGCTNDCTSLDIEIWNVEFGGQPTSFVVASPFKTISVPYKLSFAFTAIEPDLHQVGLNSSENTTLYYWIEQDPDPFVNTSRVYGAVARDTSGWSGVFNISSMWNQTLDANNKFAINGHYMKGAYYFNAATNSHRFIPVWQQSGNLHATVLDVPR